MEIVIVVAVAVLAMSPMTRRTGDADVARRFERPPTQGDLL